MGESEDCSHLVVSGGEELREMAPSSSGQNGCRRRRRSRLVAQNEAPSCHLSAEDVVEFENPLLGRVFPSSEQVLPVEEEERSFPNPLVRRNLQQQQQLLLRCLPLRKTVASTIRC